VVAAAAAAAVGTPSALRALFTASRPNYKRAIVKGAEVYKPGE
jgi:hypothetical protein